LFALPARQGGLEVDTPLKRASQEMSCSLLVTAALQDHIMAQDSEYGYDLYETQMTAKTCVKTEKKEISEKAIDDLVDRLPDCLVELARERGYSIWLIALPLSEHGFSVHKGAFHDTMALRYGWTTSQMPAQCACGKTSVQYALSSATGGFSSIRHNDIRDQTASLLTEVCNDVHAMANSQDEARQDIAANGFKGGTFQRTYLDVRVFNSLSPSNSQTSLSSCFKKHEREKRPLYCCLLLEA